MALGVPKIRTYYGSQEQFGNERVMSKEVHPLKIEQSAVAH